MLAEKTFIEVDCYQHSKEKQAVAGDVFVSEKLAGTGRTICVLSDGLGSGIKANVLATLTSTMAMKYVSSDIDICRAAKIIMETLPICKQRKIGYSTFTIFDIRNNGHVDVVEYDNPNYVLAHGSECTKVDARKIEFNVEGVGKRNLWHSQFVAKENDRAVLFTDGVTQSGIGRKDMPLGWTQESVSEHITEICQEHQEISARMLTRKIISRALSNDRNRAQDDMTCAVIYFRRPRKTLMVTGPPFDKNKDMLFARKVQKFEGNKVVCGGTTANIIARHFGKKLQVDLSTISGTVPPVSNLEGIDLVTEGILTLTKTVDILENCTNPEVLTNDAATRLVKLLLDSDIIEIVAGTRINAAHQDPNLPVELDIRKNLLRKFVDLLNKKYLKEATMEFI